MFTISPLYNPQCQDVIEDSVHCKVCSGQESKTRIGCGLNLGKIQSKAEVNQLKGMEDKHITCSLLLVDTGHFSSISGAHWTVTGRAGHISYIRSSER